MADECNSRSPTQVDHLFLWPWGANSYGQLGVGDTDDRLMPPSKPVPLCLGHVSEVVRDSGGGGGFSFILTDSGKIFTCGKNNKGQLGNDDIEIMVNFENCKFLSHVKIVKVAAGWDFMLGLSDAGQVLSWGSNTFGQLGRTLSDRVNFDSMPDVVNGSSERKHIDVAAGLRHGVSITECGRVFSWGHGRRGQLGLMDRSNKPLPKSEHPIQVQIKGEKKLTQALAGMYHSGVLTDSGTVIMWGCNKYGQCGESPNVSQAMLAPHEIVCATGNDDDKVISVASGWTHIVALTVSRLLYSWGRADLGQLGRSCEASYDHIPCSVLGLTHVRQYACGSEHTLAVTENGLVYAWGWNEHGICGTGNEENVLYPHQIQEFCGRHVARVGCGAGHSFCAVRCSQT